MRRLTPLRLFAVCALASVWMLVFASCAPLQPPAPPYFSATDISLDSPTDGWAVGSWIIPKNMPRGRSPDTSLATPEYATITPAMAHLQHGEWWLAPKPVTGDLGPNQFYRLVRMLSSGDGWATVRGLYGDTLYHFDGAHWRLAFPSQGAATNHTIAIADLQLLSSSTGWAVGPKGILQYTQGVWKDVTDSLPPRPEAWSVAWNYPGLRSVAIVSPTEAWAMGDGGAIWQYDGAHWRIVASPYFPNRYYTSASVDGFPASDTLLAHFTLEAHNQEALYAAQMLSPTDGWSVGGATLESFSSRDWGPAVVERYQAGSWQIAHIVIRAHRVNEPYREPVFSSLAMTSAQDGWIGGAWVMPTQVGTGDAGPSPGTPVYASLLLHYYAGQWSFVSAPNVGAIHRLVMVGPEEGWAAGDGGLLHYADGIWQVGQVSSI